MKIREVLISLCIYFNVAICVATEKRITNENWRDILQGEWMIKFYAPWCPACRAMTQTWKEFANWADTNMDGLSVGSIDVTAEAELNGRFMITSLPTLYHVKDGDFRQYSSSRTLKDFKEFILEKQWDKITPMSAWLGPDSIAMNGVSKLFSLSMNLKNFHENLRSEYGLPGWASMLLFGLAIIVFGLVLGICLVFFIDWFMGPQPEEDFNRPSSSHEKKDDGNSESLTDGEEEEIENKETSVRKRNVKTD